MQAPVPTLQTADGPAVEAYAVSVRSLCEFTAKGGDLDRRFTPSATALEGQQGQAAVVARRGSDYQTEITLQTQVGTLTVRGRADGYDPRRRRLEEIKTLRGTPETIPENRQRLHWAQLETYGALYCREHGLQELALSLVYYDIGSQTETELLELRAASELEAALLQRCAAFADWARQEALHRQQRDAALTALPFPLGDFRTGQRTLAEAVYRSAVQGRALLAQAPTGIGKTQGTLYPVLRAMPGQQLDKIAYLTCKGTGRIAAMDALEALRAAAPGRHLRVLAVVARDQACEHPDKACHGDACPLARGFYDRLPAARAEAVALGWLDAAAQRRVALRHGICPYYLGQELLRWTDVLVGDVHHAFDHHGQLWGLMQALDWRVALLVDEAHNLVERARAMYSTTVSLQQLRRGARTVPAVLRARFQALLREFDALGAALDTAYAVLPEVPESLALALQGYNAALAEHLQSQPLTVGPLLTQHFELLRLQRHLEALGPHSLFDVQRVGPRQAGPDAVDAAAAVPLVTAGRSPRAFEPFAAEPEPLWQGLPIPARAPHPPDVNRDGEAEADGDVEFSVRNLVPAGYLKTRFEGMRSSTLFSATLGPPQYQIDLLGLPADTAWLDVPPVFAPEHLVVQVASHISTRFPHRKHSLQALVAVLAQQYRRHPGNYLAFFSSFAYLQQVAEALALQHPEIPQWRQGRVMDPGARSAFLDLFQAGGQGIGFAVLGGVFSEGVDLPGRRLIGVFIATLALPPVSPLQDQIKARLDSLFGSGHGYADRVPAMQKVVQAAGRVLRTPEDRGWLWLLDDRYRRGEVRALLPTAWGL